MIEEGNQGRQSESMKDLLQSVFLLKKSSSNSTVSIEVDFSPANFKSQQSFPSLLKTLPTFNTDGNFFTPSFVLEVDQLRNEETLNIYRSIHDKKYIQISEQKSEIFIPKPSKNNSFCCVCKAPFQDYLSHLGESKHRYLLKKSQYCTKISDICQFFSQKKLPNCETAVAKKKRGRPAKAKGIKKEGVSSRRLSIRLTNEEQKVEHANLNVG